MDKLGQLSLDKLSLDKMKNMVGEVRDRVSARNETEKRVYEALSNKNWGASSTMLNDIARDTYDFEKYGQILPLIWTTMESPSREWRKVFKALALLEHLIKNGAERVIEDARDHLHRVRMLSDFNYYEGPVDKGTGVREKSKQLIELLKDNELIREEREKARKLRDKYVGLGSGGGGGGGGYSGGGGGYSGSSYSGGGGGYNGSGGGGYNGGGGGGYAGSGVGSGSRYGDAYSSGGGGGGSYSGGAGTTGRYSDNVDREGYSGTIAKGKYSDDSAETSGGSGSTKNEETDKEPSKPKKSKKSSGSKLEIKIKDKGASGSSKPSRSPAPAPSPTPAPTAAMPDLLGGDLLSGAAPASGGAGGFDNFFAAAPVSVAVPTNGNGSSITFDGFDPRGTASTTPATAPAMPSPAAGALAAGQGGRDLFGQEFAGFSAAPPAASGFLGGGGGAAFGGDLFSASPAPTLTTASSTGGGLMGNGFSGFSGANNNNGIHARAPSSGVDEFSDFQGSSPAGASSGNSKGAGTGVAATNGRTSGISNPKWRDVSALVDLGGLTSNTDKKVAQQKVVEQTFQSNNNSFAGLDGFHAPRGQGVGMSRPISNIAGGAGMQTGMMGVGGAMGGGMGYPQRPQQQSGGWMGQQGGMGLAPVGGMTGSSRMMPGAVGGQQFMGQQGMGMGMGGMQGQMGGMMQQNKNNAGGARGAGNGGTTMPGGFF